MTGKFYSFCFLILSWILISKASVQASSPIRELEVKEIKLSIFNKPVTGFQVLIDKKSSSVYNQILRHVSLFSDKPFQFENTIIYENITYPPVTKIRELSLYFLVRTLPGNFTELTYVVMYDYKRSVSSKEFPDLTMRLLVDLAGIIKRISGDEIRFDEMVLDDKTMKDIAESEKKHEAESVSDSMIDNPGEEDVHNEDVLIRQNPFSKKGEDTGITSSLAVSVNEKANALEKLEFELQKREAEIRKREEEQSLNSNYSQEVVSRNKVLQDTIYQLRKQIATAGYSQYAGDPSSYSTRDAEEFSLLEDKLAAVQKENAHGKFMADSLLAQLAKIRLENVKNAKANEALAEDLKNMRQENSKLRSDYLVLKSKVTGLAPPDAAISEAKITSLEQEKKALEKQVSDLNQKLNLVKGNAPAEAQVLEIQRLRDSVNRLQAMVASAGDPAKSLQAISGLQDKIQSLEKENSQQRLEKDQLQAKLKASAETLKQVQSTSEAMLVKVEGFQKQTAELRLELENAEKNMGNLNAQILSVRDSLKKTNANAAKTEASLREADMNMTAMNRRVDSLSKTVIAEIGIREKLNEEAFKQKRNADSLGLALNEALRIQNLNPNELVQKLLEKEKLLNERERANEDRQKLLAQREANAEIQKKQLEEMEIKYKDILERETKLKALEQQLRQKGGSEIVETKINQTPIVEHNYQVTVVKTSENGVTIPVFEVETILNFKKTELQIAAYMAHLGFLANERFPDLIFENILMTKISPESLNVKFHLLAKGETTLLRATFKLPDGSFLDPSNNVNDAYKVKDFLNKLLNYSY